MSGRPGLIGHLRGGGHHARNRSFDPFRRGKGLLPPDQTARADGPRPGGLTAKTTPHMSGVSMSLITRQMATLLRSGLCIEVALQTIARGQPPKVAGVLLTLRAHGLECQSFAAVLACFPTIFSDFFRAPVRAGKLSGRLGRVMTHLAAFVENRARNRQTVQLALLYPALPGVVSLGIVTLLMVFVVPDIVQVFRDRGAGLPLFARALMALSEAVRFQGLYAVAFVAVGGLCLPLWLKIPANILPLHRFLATNRLTRSLVRRLVRRMNAVQFADTLATLLRSRVPPTKASSAAADVTPNSFTRARVTEVGEKIRHGINLHRAMDGAKTFPAMIVAMVASGEAGGYPGTARDPAATGRQRDLDVCFRAMVTLVEPAIFPIRGGLLVSMVLAILVPIMALNTLVDGYFRVRSIPMPDQISGQRTPCGP